MELICPGSTSRSSRMPDSSLRGSDLAVIVTTYNRPAALAWVLASLSKQSVMPGWIVIADDGSGLATRELVSIWQRHFQQQKLRSSLLHAWQEDKGFRAAAARNLAVREVVKVGSPRALVFLDGDCVAPPYFLESHLRLLRPRKLVAGGRGLLTSSYTRQLEQLADQAPPHELSYALEAFSSPYRLWLSKSCDRLFAMKRFTNPLFDVFRDLRPRDERRVRTCNLSLWIEDFDRAGQFDESFVGWGLEDTDLAIRLIRAGVRVRSGRFATNVFHLWHPERSRTDLQKNSARLAVKQCQFAQSTTPRD